MKVYTKQGDTGYSQLGNGTSKKTNLAFELLGDLDELSAAIGVANTEYSDDWINLQTFLLDVGSVISLFQKINVEKIKTKTDELESWIDRLTDQLPELKNFIIPIGKASQWHVARSICRRVERHFWLCHIEEVYSNHDVCIGTYFNRLSDLLFQQARLCSDGDVRYKQSKGLF